MQFLEISAFASEYVDLLNCGSKNQYLETTYLYTSAHRVNTTIFI